MIKNCLCSKRVKQHNYVIRMIKSANKINKWSALGLLAASGVSVAVGVGVNVGVGVGTAHVTVSLRRCKKNAS